MNALRLVSILLLAVVIAGALCAATEVVFPPYLKGWVIATQQGTGAWPPIGSFAVGQGTPPAGTCSFHMQTPYSHSDPLPKIYFGTNNHTGINLRDVTSFRFWTYMHHRDYDPGQPPMIEIITDSGSTTQQRRFVFHPWGRYGNQNVAFDAWQEWDLMAATGHWELIHTSSTNYMGNWNWVKSRYGDADHPMKLVQPPVGDYPTGVQTGTSINIKIGSGSAIDGRYGAWWQQSCTIDAYVDMLTIGINGVETVYDFELNGPLPPLFGLNNRAACDPIISRAKDWRRFKTWGVVQEDGYGFEYFILDDGSGTPINVHAWMHPAQIGNFVSATGALDPSTSPPTLKSSAPEIVILDP